MNRRHFCLSSAALPAALASAATETPKARLKAALCAYSYREELIAKKLTYEDLVRMCADWGIDGIDTTVYWFPSTDPAWLAGLRNLAYRQGVSLYSIAIRTELTRADAAARDAEVKAIEKWVDVAQRLGAGHIRVFGGNVPKGVTEEQAVPWVVECLKRAADIAGAKGIVLGLENHGGICTRADRMLEILAIVNSPWTGINLDTGNFRTQAFEQMQMCLSRAVNVQVKAEMTYDDGRQGPQDWERVIKLIAAGGYRGYLSLEYEAKEPAAIAVPRGLKQLAALAAKYSA